MAKLLGAVSSDLSNESAREPDDDTADEEQQLEESAAGPTNPTIDDEEPARDGRVAWLIREIGSRRALSHRQEDMWRQRYGRGQHGLGYCIKQFSALTDSAGSNRTNSCLAAVERARLPCCESTLKRAFTQELKARTVELCASWQRIMRSIAAFSAPV